MDNNIEYLKEELNKFKKREDKQINDEFLLQNPDELTKYLLKQRKLLENKIKNSRTSSGNTKPTLKNRGKKYKIKNKLQRKARKKNKK